MLEDLTLLLTQFNDYTKSNPVLAGIVSLYGLAVVTFVLRNVPARIWGLISHQCTTRIVIDNSSDGRNEELFMRIMDWFETSGWSRWSRALRIYSGWSAWSMKGFTFDFVVGIDGSLQFAMWEGMPCVLRRRTVSDGQSASSKIIYEITLTRLGRNRESLLRFFKAIRPEVKDDRPYNYHWGKDGWSRGGRIAPRKLESVIVDRSVKYGILNAFEWFRDNEAWYNDHGIPYKLSIMLTGAPGGGKTSLIRALATTWNRPVFNISLANITDEELRRAFLQSDSNGILLLEDFNHSALLARNEQLKHQPMPKSPPKGVKNQFGYVSEPSVSSTKSETDTYSLLTMQGFLQVFDGMDSMHGRIVFLTTNVVAELDSAVTRKGRIDHTFELGKLEHHDILEYIKLCFPDRLPAPYSASIRETLTYCRFAPIVGSDLQALFMKHPFDIHAFIHSIPTIQESDTAHAHDHPTREEAAT